MTQFGILGYTVIVICLAMYVGSNDAGMGRLHTCRFSALRKEIAALRQKLETLRHDA